MCCFFLFFFFSGFLKEAVKVWKTFFLKLLLPFLLHVHWWMPSFDLHLFFFWASDFPYSSHWLLFLYTLPLFTCSDIFQIRSVSHPMHTCEFCIFCECVIIVNSEAVNLSESFGCLLLLSVSYTLSCNVWILSRQDYGKTPDDNFLGSQNNGFCIFTTINFLQEPRVTECKISMQNLIVITRTGHWNPNIMSCSLNLSSGRPVFS